MMRVNKLKKQLILTLRIYYHICQERGRVVQWPFCATQIRFVHAFLGASWWCSLRGGGPFEPTYFKIKEQSANFATEPDRNQKGGGVTGGGEGSGGSLEGALGEC